MQMEHSGGNETKNHLFLKVFGVLLKLYDTSSLFDIHEM